MTAVTLACLVNPGTPRDALNAWAELVAPEVSLRAVTPDLAGIAGLDTPYAVLGAGSLGLAAFDLAGRLAATGRGPSRLVLCECPPPAADAAPLSCPIVVFAGAGSADDLAPWRAASTAGFTLRLLDEREAPPHGRANADVALALKEELQVWPY
jgi:surfactin synthase thioesterase subunit